MDGVGIVERKIMKLNLPEGGLKLSYGGVLKEVEVAYEECGAPLDLCTLALAAPLEMLCAVDFTRCAVRLRQEDALCELALDEGELRHGTRTAPLYEIELELRAGGEQPFHALAAALADRFSLIPEPESKLARALRL